MKKLIIFIFICIFAYSIPAMGQKSLSLDDCINIALKSNKEIQMSQYDIMKSRAQITQARAGALPTLTGSGTFSYSYEQITMTLPGILIGKPQLGYIKIPLGEKDNYSMNATFRQPLFNASAFIAPSAAKTFSHFVEEGVKAKEQEVILNVKSAYFSILLMQALSRVTEESYQYAEAMLERIKRYQKSGQVSNFDVLRAEVEVANLKPKVIQSKNGVKLAMLNLKNMLSIDDSTEIILTDTLQYNPISISLDSALESAKKNRHDLRAFEYQIEGYKKYMRAQQLSRLPTITGLVTYDLNYDHYKVDGNSWEDKLMGIISLNITYIPFLNNGYTRGAINQAKADYKKSQVMYEQISNYVEIEVEQAYLSVKEADERVQASKLNVDKAKETVRIAQLRYEQGMNTQLEERDARLALLLAETNYIQALYDYNVAVAKLQKAMGGVEW